MTLPFRSILALSLLVVVLAACSTATSTPSPSTPPASEAPDPSTAPSQAPSESPDASFETAGTVTYMDLGGPIDGPGESITDALAAARTTPTIVNGVLFMDADGNIFLAESVTDASVPTFGGPILEVIDYPDIPEQWDMANAELIGLQEANGIRFLENAQVYGLVAP